MNVIVSDAGADAGVGRFGFFEFALVGVPLVVGTIAIVALLGERLLPSRTARTIGADFSGHARNFVRQYELEHPPEELVTRVRRRRGGDPAAPALIGSLVFPGMVTDSGDLVVLAVHGQARRSSDGAGRGQCCCCAAPRRRSRAARGPRRARRRAPALVRRQAVPLGPGRSGRSPCSP